MTISTSELWIGNAGPLSTAISYTSTSHHVAHVMLLIPLVPNTVHDTIIGCADFFMGCMRRKQENIYEARIYKILKTKTICNAPSYQAVVSAS